MIFQACFNFGTKGQATRRANCEHSMQPLQCAFEPTLRKHSAISGFSGNYIGQSTDNIWRWEILFWLLFNAFLQHELRWLYSWAVTNTIFCSIFVFKLLHCQQMTFHVHFWKKIANEIGNRKWNSFLRTAVWYLLYTCADHIEI